MGSRGVCGCESLDFTAGDAEHVADIRFHLHQTGQMIRSNDLLIAGQARARGMVLVTNNTREFERVPDLRVENW
jgi:tRNA(fMet)-specific endonuclease VapC